MSLDVKQKRQSYRNENVTRSKVDLDARRDRKPSQFSKSACRLLTK